MKNFKFFTASVLVMLLMGHTYANLSTAGFCDEYNCCDTSFASDEGLEKDYDFSSLKPGETQDINGYDAKGKIFKYRVTRTSNGIDVSVYSNSLQNIDPNTMVSFKNPSGEVSTVILGDVASQRCGWLCVLVHICCIQVHIGPPGNTWEWSCDCVTQSNN